MVSSGRADIGLAAEFNNVSVEEVLEADSRPTFVIDLDSDSVSPQSAAGIHPVFCNAALRLHERLVDALVGPEAQGFPLRDLSSGVPQEIATGGLWAQDRCRDNAPFEVTNQVINQRRMKTINTLREHVAHAKTVKQIWRDLLEGLEENHFDAPFALLYYVVEDEGGDYSSVSVSMSSESSMSLKTCHLEGSIGVPDGHIAAPARVDLKRSLDGFVQRNISASTRGPAKASLGEISILVVEDNLINQTVLVRQLRKAGCTVSAANDGVGSLELLQQTHFFVKGGRELSVILMDLEMPRMDGLTCVREIRKMEDDGRIGRHVPVIAVTANVRVEQVEAAKSSGMDDVVSKPFRIPDLLLKMEALLQHEMYDDDEDDDRLLKKDC